MEKAVFFSEAAAMGRLNFKLMELASSFASLTVGPAGGGVNSGPQSNSWMVEVAMCDGRTVTTGVGGGVSRVQAPDVPVFTMMSLMSASTTSVGSSGKSDAGSDAVAC